MGQFADDVRNNLIAHPLARGFDRERWAAGKAEDATDKALLASGLAVADMLSAMRPHALLKTKDRNLLKALVAFANHQTAGTHREIFDYARAAIESGISMDAVLARKEHATGGTLGEVTDGLGDSFVYPLREAMDPSPKKTPARTKREWLEAVERGLDHGGVDVLAAALVAAAHGGDDRHRGEEARGDVDDRKADLYRIAVRFVAAHHHHAGEGLHDVVVAAAPGPFALLP